VGGVFGITFLYQHTTFLSFFYFQYQLLLYCIDLLEPVDTKTSFFYASYLSNIDTGGYKVQFYYLALSYGKGNTLFLRNSEYQRRV